MAVHRYLLRADIRARWRSLALFTVLVTVVVAAVLTSVAAARRTESSFERFLTQVRPFDAVATPAGGPIDDLDGIEDVEGVAAAVGFHWYSAFPGDLESEFFPMAVPDDDRVPETYLRNPVVDGRRPDPDEPLEVALSERAARRLGVEVGDPLPVATFTDEQDADGFPSPDDAGRLELDVVGILRTPADVASRDSDLEINFLTPAFAEVYRDEVGVFAVGSLVVLEPGASPDEVGGRVQEAYGVDFESFFGADTLRSQAEPTLDAMATGLRIVALVLALVGGTAIALSLVRDTTDRLAEQSSLRAFGFEGRGLLVHLGLASAVAALVGVVLGGALSTLLAPRVIWGLARRAEVRPELRLDQPVLVVGMVVAATVLLLLVAVVATVTLRRERRELLEGGRPSSVATRAARLGAPISVVAGLRLAFERGRGARTIPVTAAAVAAGLGGLGVVSALVFSSSLQHAVTTPGMYGWDFDVVLGRVADGPEPPVEADAAAAAMAEDPDLSAVAEYVLDFDVQMGGGPERAVFLDDVTGHTPIVVARGHEPRNPGEVAVGATTLADEGLRLGDQVEVERQGEVRTLEIVGVAVLPVNDDGGLGSEGLALHPETAEALGFDGTCSDEEPCSRGFAVTVADGHDVQATVERYLPAGYSMVEPSPPSEVVRLTAIDRLPWMVAVFLGVISVITLAHAAAVTVRRRHRDLAVLRVLGFCRRDLRNAVRVQVAALSVLGGVLGVVLGLALGRQLWFGVAGSVSLPAVITLPALTIVSAPLVIALLAQVGATVPRRAAGRVPAGVVLRSE
jgi:ABC-type lipoprotein release transport system permease subunit